MDASTAPAREAPVVPGCIGNPEVRLTEGRRVSGSCAKLAVLLALAHGSTALHEVRRGLESGAPAARMLIQMRTARREIEQAEGLILIDRLEQMVGQADERPARAAQEVARLLDWQAAKRRTRDDRARTERRLHWSSN